MNILVSKGLGNTSFPPSYPISSIPSKNTPSHSFPFKIIILIYIPFYPNSQPISSHSQIPTNTNSSLTSTQLPSHPNRIPILSHYLNPHPTPPIPSKLSSNPLSPLNPICTFNSSHLIPIPTHSFLSISNPSFFFDFHSIPF